MANGDLERRLGEVLRQRATGFDPSPDLPERIGTRTRQRQHNRRVAGGALAAVVLAVVVAVPLALRDDRSDQLATTSRDADTAAVATSAAGAPALASAAPAEPSTRAGADTTAAAGAAESATGDEDADAAADTGSPGAGGAPTTTVAAAETPAAAGTTTPVTSAAPVPPPSANPPPYLLAVMPGDERVALVSSTTGAVARYVDDAARLGTVQFDQDGTEVYRVPGCGDLPTSYFVNEFAVIRDPAQTDATAMSRGSDSLALARPTDCNDPGAGSVLTIQPSDGDPAAPVRTFAVRGTLGDGTQGVRELVFSPDGSTLVWPEPQGLAVLDLTDPASTPEFLVNPNPLCPVEEPAFVPGTTRLLAVNQCEGNPPVVYTYDLATPGAPPEQASPPVAGLAEMRDLDVDPSGQFLVFTGTAADGASTVYVVTLDGPPVSAIPGAHSSHWTTATG